MNFESVEKIAAAILYEGYILYPYRPTAVKNRQRWNFGTLYPQIYAEAQRPAEPYRLVAECLAMVGGQATTMVKINGNDTRFVLDTGAFFDTMSRANALSLGLKLRPAPFGFRIGGVGGSADAQFAQVKDFGILGTTLHDIAFIVGGTDAGHGLLGANLLDFADLSAMQTGGV